MKNPIEAIQEAKKAQNAVILAHYYEEGPIQDVADFVGDSFYLAKMGQEIKADTILLAGVVFMAESVKILNPEKDVLVPDLNAGCSLVEGAPFDKYLQWRKDHPDAICVTYINSSAEVKSISDVIVTSSNAEKIVATIPKDRRILFGPDQHLGRWLSKKMNREMILWPGACEVHVLFNAKRLFELIGQHPDAVVLAHPECEENILQYAHVVGSTSRLLQEVAQNKNKKFIVATESGIFHQMQKQRPEAELIQAPIADGTCGCNQCPYMKLNTLQKVHKALTDHKPLVNLSPELMIKARGSLERMMKIVRGEKVEWPERFSV